MTDPFKYQGQELALFEKAINWKKYFSGLIQPHITGRVLECGAGIGSTCKVLNDGIAKEWILLEPDKEMAALLKMKIKNNELPNNCIVIENTIAFFGNSPQFDTIIYIDVLEHIENDKDEITKAASLLNQNGNLIILSPAFPSLYSKFDKAIGHYRRYTKKQIESLTPTLLKKKFVRYIDSLGFFLSLANKFMLKQSYPTVKQISFWDKYFVQTSKILDKVFSYSFGKSILGIWQKNRIDVK